MKKYYFLFIMLYYIYSYFYPIEGMGISHRILEISRENLKITANVFHTERNTRIVFSQRSEIKFKLSFPLLKMDKKDFRIRDLFKREYNFKSHEKYFQSKVYKVYKNNEKNQVFLSLLNQDFNKNIISFVLFIPYTHLIHLKKEDIWIDCNYTINKYYRFKNCFSNVLKNNFKNSFFIVKKQKFLDNFSEFLKYFDNFIDFVNLLLVKEISINKKYIYSYNLFRNCNTRIKFLSNILYIKFNSMFFKYKEKIQYIFSNRIKKTSYYT